jgi:uncharacterized protein with HEPN domain
MLLEGKSESTLAGDRFARMALERLLEIISEASRHLPQEWKQSLGADVPWSNIASVGNVLRHTYDRVELSVLWSIYENDLDPLERAIDTMLATHGSDSR